MNGNGPSAAEQNNTRRIVLWMMAALEGLILFIGAQLVLRTLALRDEVNMLRTEVSRIEERQKNYLTLFESKLAGLQAQITHIEARPPQ
jgi:hypothetical protein